MRIPKCKSEECSALNSYGTKYEGYCLDCWNSELFVEIARLRDLLQKAYDFNGYGMINLQFPGWAEDVQEALK